MRKDAAGNSLKHKTSETHKVHMGVTFKYKDLEIWENYSSFGWKYYLSSNGGKNTKC